MFKYLPFSASWSSFLGSGSLGNRCSLRAPERRSTVPRKSVSKRSLTRQLAQLEQLESRWVQTATPFGALANDTGEFMLGRVAVTPVFLESTGQIDPSIENWNQAHKEQVVAKLQESLVWWQDLLATQTSIHTLDFVIDTTYIDTPSPTAYEPINRRSDDYVLWTQEFLMREGFTQFNSIEQNIRAFNHAQRQRWEANWAFTIFVVNSEVEQDGTFASGGSFSRAFAFAGGQFYVVPSTRPASTFAHETGHMFWARDEYAGSASYYARRGYYNTQNTNAFDGNPNSNFVQAPSIMSAGTSLTIAYQQLISPPSTLAQLGWQDSDGNGIFDVLDVPLMLDGVGRVDVTTGRYLFSGTAQVQTLPNLNTSGLGNDITLNRVSRIEARLNDGPWQTVASPNLYRATLNLSIPLEGVQSGQILIRAVDDGTGITSNLFEGSIDARPDTVPVLGINGFVFNDANANGLFDAIESGMGATSVRLVDADGQAILLERQIEPDAHVPGIVASGAYPNVTLSVFGSDSNGTFGSFTDIHATTGARVFRPYSLARVGFADSWNARRRLQVEFHTSTSLVSVDVIGASNGSYGRLEVYDRQDRLLARVTSDALLAGQAQKLEIGRDTADIAYMVVYGHMETGVKIDNLRYGPKTQTITDSSGRFRFANLPDGQYNVQVVLPGATARVTSEAGGTQAVQLQSAPLQHINYGVNFQASAWHNAKLAADVNDDGFVTALDALLIINLLNRNTPASLAGSGLASPPFVDVSNDAFLTSLDALLVINALNSGAGEGEPVQLGSSQFISTGSGQPEGEACEPFSFSMPEGEGWSPSLSGQGAPGLRGFMGPLWQPADAMTFQPVQDTLPSAWGNPTVGAEAEQDEPCPVESLAVAQVPPESDLIARLLANPWTPARPCNCPECLSWDLAELRTS